jgi:beta-lactamase regulating signal transducer with metallopeptidase domain
MSNFANAGILAVPVAAVIWIALRLTPRRALNAATRYAIWWVTFAVTLALPLLFVMPNRAPATHPAAVGRIHVEERQIDAAASIPAALTVRLPVEAGIPWTRDLALVWVLWSGLMLIRLLLSLRAVQHARAGARVLWNIWQPRIVRIMMADVAAPFASGPIRPSILIPARLFEQLSAADLDRVILHESAHLARYDDLAIIAERVLVTLFPWHPAARFIARQIDLEREIACDDRVVEATGSASGYADCLTRVVDLCGGVRPSYTAAAMASHRAHLSRRVESLLAPARSSHPGLRIIRAVPFAAGLLLLALVCVRAPRLVAFAASASAAAPQAVGPVDPVPAPAAPRAPAPMPAQRPSPRPSSPQPAQQAPVQSPADKRYRVLLFDLPSFTPDDLDRAIKASQRVVESTRENDVFAVMTVENGAVVVRQDFTADRDLLHAAVTKIASDADAVSAGPLSIGRSSAMLETAIRVLAGIKEKKALIYITSADRVDSDDDNDRSLMQHVVNEAVRANVAFYFVDARGGGR